MLVDATFNVITAQIIGAAIEVHRTLGPGLLESTYMPCLQCELTARKLRFVTQRAVPIVYKGMALDATYRIDLLVEDLVVVELKSVDRLLLASASGPGADVHGSHGVPRGTAHQLQCGEADRRREAAD